MMVVVVVMVMRLLVSGDDDVDTDEDDGRLISIIDCQGAGCCGRGQPPRCVPVPASTCTITSTYKH